jgi:hypothetical protein
MTLHCIIHPISDEDTKAQWHQSYNTSNEELEFKGRPGLGQSRHKTKWTHLGPSDTSRPRSWVCLLVCSLLAQITLCMLEELKKQKPLNSSFSFWKFTFYYDIHLFEKLFLKASKGRHRKQKLEKSGEIVVSKNPRFRKATAYKAQLWAPWQHRQKEKGNVFYSPQRRYGNLLTWAPARVWEPQWWLKHFRSWFLWGLSHRLSPPQTFVQWQRGWGHSERLGGPEV